ncbi:hypothetical protein [Ralstonia sp. ASV6]|uniref:hypothetical protein n=1 Tax=Ralstonia sp. ASV6 TaxID=2795124 RepID=UPI0018ED617A|nr:hypothetical protein [Ralstonia sp. ASV6]
MKENISTLVTQILQQTMGSGLTWDEAVTAFGLAAKAATAAAAEANHGSAEACEALARARFEEAFAQKVNVVMARSDLTRLKEACSDVDVTALLANFNVKVAIRH